MCGINGMVSRTLTNEELSNKLQKMNQHILHRGPDEDGFYYHQNHQNQIGMAMRRLSIIDLSSGKQPIFSDDKNLVILFNGEIYNYKSLKSDLISKGYIFYTQSDTEVILKIYEEYGTEGFKKLDGMFAFNLHDKKLNKIFIARDFFGEKPLYYFKNEKEIFWASELKSLVNALDNKPDICKTALNLYLKLTYIPAPYTIYNGINKLEANRLLSLDLESFTIDIQPIHPENTNIEKLDISFDEAKKRCFDLVNESVLSRSVSDVPIGTFLSGGVDSSVVSWCLAKQMDTKINTFSIGFSKKDFDESEKSRIVAKLLGSSHHEFIIDENDLKENIHKIVNNFDEPFADSSALPTYLVASKTKQKVTVALTGDGGDEVFGGYNKYLIGQINTKFTKIFPEFLHNKLLGTVDFLTKQNEDKRGLKYKLNKAYRSIDYNYQSFYNIIQLGFQGQSLEQILLPNYLENSSLDYYKEKTPKAKNLNDFRLIDKMLSLEGDMLVKVDRTSMLSSLECRAPFLNKKIWDFTLSLPENYLLNGKNKKQLLKKAFEDKFPKEFLEKSKKGFGVPVGDWLKQGLKSELESYIEKDFIEKQGIFNYSEISSLVQRHLNSLKDESFKVWTFYCFQKWYKCNML